MTASFDSDRVSADSIQQSGGFAIYPQPRKEYSIHRCILTAWMVMNFRPQSGKSSAFFTLILNVLFDY